MPQLGSETPLDAVLAAMHTVQAVISSHLAPSICYQRMLLPSTAGVLPCNCQPGSSMLTVQP
jgi:hypothetical protein